MTMYARITHTARMGFVAKAKSTGGMTETTAPTNGMNARSWLKTGNERADERAVAAKKGADGGRRSG
jgi:hypothetical protein